jgi:hypothetical protein
MPSRRKANLLFALCLISARHVNYIQELCLLEKEELDVKAPQNFCCVHVVVFTLSAFASPASLEARSFTVVNRPVQRPSASL